ncbi:GNAT family N-acetyltransferase [Maricaulaceae bacterium MS644]
MRTSDTIRLAHCGDMAGLAALIHAAVHEGAAGAYTPDQLAAWSPAPRSAAGMAKRLSGQIILAAEDAAGLSGVFTLTGAGEIDFAYVRPDRKGDGLAGALYDAILQHARARGLATLTVQASHIARRFFEKRGWTLVETQTVRPNGVAMENHRMMIKISR